MSEKVKVLIVDDSALVRQVLREVMSAEKDIEVIGTASDPYRAVEMIAKQVPDVISLDIEMPRMDGLTFLRKLMKQHPIPVVIISSLTQEGSETAVRALDYGAVDIITKPRVYNKTFFEEAKIQICDTIRAARKARLSKVRDITVQPKYRTDVLMRRKVRRSMVETTEKVIAIGASTGGTEALQHFLQSMPYDAPGILIVQHMPEMFTKAFASRLNNVCKITVKEAEAGDSVIPGRALIAPGNSHMILKRSGARYYIQLNDGPLINRHRPSVDVLFRSAAEYAGNNALGILMTGMGDDGARGLLEMREAGAHTIAQDEKTCVVFGMPREAIKLGAAGHVLGLKQIPEFVIKKIMSNEFEKDKKQC